MLLVREIMYCKPGKVRPMVDKFLRMSQLMEKKGMGKMRVMTDFCGERYWTIVSEFEVANMDEFGKLMSDTSSEDAKEFEAIMKDYHEHIDYGRREIYNIEG